MSFDIAVDGHVPQRGLLHAATLLVVSTHCLAGPRPRARVRRRTAPALSPRLQLAPCVLRLQHSIGSGVPVLEGALQLTLLVGRNGQHAGVESERRVNKPVVLRLTRLHGLADAAGEYWVLRLRGKPQRRLLR